MPTKESETRTALETMGDRAKKAARRLAMAPTEVKNAALRKMAENLRKNEAKIL